MMRVFLKINGCISRELDLHRVKNYFILNDCEIITNPEDADLIIYSTCAVNKESVNRCVNEMDQLNLFQKNTILIGCLPAIMPDLIHERNLKTLSPMQLGDFDIYFPDFKVKFFKTPLSFQTINGQKSKYLLDKSNLSSKMIFQLSFGKSMFFKWKFYNFHRKLLDKKSCFLVASRGCNNHCTYCGIKKAVGSLKSETPNDIYEVYKTLIIQGNKHIIFYSDDTASYGEDINFSFSDLLIELDKLSQDDVTWELDFVHPKKLLEHFNTISYLVQKKRIIILECPTQHFSQSILKRMNRNYNILEVIEKLNILKFQNDNLYIITHHIIGFPGETDEDMDTAIELIKRSPFSFIEVLAYFENESCAAKKMLPKIDNEIISNRIIKMNHVLDKFKILHRLNINFYISSKELKLRFVTNKLNLKK